MDPFLSELFQSHPDILKILLAMGTFRAVFKPLMAAIGWLVKLTPFQTDDMWLASLQDSKVFKALAWSLDYFTSIKVPQPSPALEQLKKEAQDAGQIKAPLPPS